jgi:hypothetical protein
VARIFAAIFWNEFNDSTRIALADKIQQFRCRKPKRQSWSDAKGVQRAAEDEAARRRVTYSST